MATRFHETFENRVQPAIERAFGVTVTLRRGSLVTDSFTATFVEQDYDAIEHETGIQVKVSMRDYFLPVSSVVLAGKEVEPTEGMVVVDGSHEFEILPVPGKPAVELQPGGYRYLVHTKRISM